MGGDAQPLCPGGGIAGFHPGDSGTALHARERSRHVVVGCHQLAERVGDRLGMGRHRLRPLGQGLRELCSKRCPEDDRAVLLFCEVPTTKGTRGHEVEDETFDHGPDRFEEVEGHRLPASCIEMEKTHTRIEA
jgi:hypothetical protein